MSTSRKAKTIIPVQDNLNTHAAASLYEAFPVAEARRLVERFEWHDAPKHGSWLDLAESELGVLASQCLDRLIPDKQTITAEVAARVRDRNKNHAVAEWHFTADDALRYDRIEPLATKNVALVRRMIQSDRQVGMHDLGRSRPERHR
jgi:hypothetical protein